MTSQLSLLAVPSVDAAEEAARSLIRPYVNRGDNPNTIRDGGLGFSGTWSAQIGGYIDPCEELVPNKHYTRDFILVTRDVEGKECRRVFRFNDIYRAVQAEQ